MKAAGRRVPLDAIAVHQVRDLDARSTGRTPNEYTPTQIATALEFLERLELCRIRPHQTDALYGALGTIEPLRGLVELLRDARITELEHDAQRFLADALEYFTVRLELAATPAAERVARYVVMVPR